MTVEQTELLASALHRGAATVGKPRESFLPDIKKDGKDDDDSDSIDSPEVIQKKKEDMKRFKKELKEISKKQLEEIDLAAAGTNSKVAQLMIEEKKHIKKRSLDIAKNLNGKAPHQRKERKDEFKEMIEELEKKVGTAQHNESKRLAIIKEVPKKDSDFIFKTVSRAKSNYEILAK